MAGSRARMWHGSRQKILDFSPLPAQAAGEGGEQSELPLTFKVNINCTSLRSATLSPTLSRSMNLHAWA